ncbi:MAG TPA: hypothetical protein VKU85_07230 [bacterium]|nr:hypothetical protein [bacterium]
MSAAAGRGRRALLLILALLAGSGCGSSAQYLDPSDEATWTTLNERAGNDSTRIRLPGAETFQPVFTATFAPDTTRWRDEAGEVRAAPTREISRISFRSHAQGAREGANGGLKLGAAVAVISLVAFSQQSHVEGSGGLAFLGLTAPVTLGGAGAILGGIWGVEEVIWLWERPPPDTRYRPTSGAPDPSRERPGDPGGSE